jgi:excisionase family DNA binding protein
MSVSNQFAPADEPLIGIDEASTILGLKRSTLYARTSNRSIPHYKRGGKLYFRRSELIDWLTQGRRPVIDGSAATNHLSRQRGGK